MSLVTLGQKSNSDAPIIAAPSALLFQLTVALNRKTPSANSDTPATTSIFFGKGLRRQSSVWRWRPFENS
jgi:hypothetical protein